jgi:hypothetical protein
LNGGEGSLDGGIGHFGKHEIGYDEQEQVKAEMFHIGKAFVWEV